MKKLLVASVFIVIVLGGIWVSKTVVDKNNQNVGGASWGIPATKVLAGSLTNAVSMPRIISFSNATTTDSDAAGDDKTLDGGQTITQAIETDGVSSVILEGLFQGGTATSTLTIRQQTSLDGVDWFDVWASSTSTDPGIRTTGTSSIALIPTALTITPGIATTTYAIKQFDTRGSKWTRFLFVATDLTTDPNDGVQAYINAIRVQDQYR